MPRFDVIASTARSLGLPLLACSWCFASSAATVLLSNPDSGLAASMVLDNSKLIGLVGDYVVLEPGDHDLRIDAPRSYTMIVKLLVDQDSVKVVSANVQPGNCKPAFETTLDPPTVVSNAKKQSAGSERGGQPEGQGAAPGSDSRVSTIVLNTPRYGQSVKTGSCALPSMLGCTKQFAVVAVESTPPGAEIWVDYEKMSVKTKATLSVAFCPSSDATKDILVRMPGRSTCTKQVAVSSAERSTVTCDLPMPTE